MLPSNVISFLLIYLLRYRSRITFVAVGLLTVLISLIAMGSLLRSFFDVISVVSDNGDVSLLKNKFYIFILIMTFLSLGSFLRSYNIYMVAETIANDIRKALYSKFLSLDIENLDSIKNADIISLLTSDVEEVRGFIIDGLSFFVRNFLMLIACIIMMFMQSYILSTLVIITIPILIIPVLFWGKKIKKFSKSAADSYKDILSYVDEIVVGIRTICAYNSSNYISNHLDIKSSEYMYKAKTRFKNRSIFFAFIVFLISIAILSIIAFGIFEMLAGKFTPGIIVSFVYYAAFASICFGVVLEFFSKLHGPIIALQNIIKFLNSTSSDVSDASDINIINLEDNNQIGKLHNKTISFKDVDFSYPSSNEIKILNKVNCVIYPHNVNILVGPSGSGKSTLMQLLIKFYNINNGQISFDNYDINKIDSRLLRSKISYVQQFPNIFTGTIKENITFGSNFADEDIYKVCEICGINEFANSLKNGIDSTIGEKGSKLSGGQRQRIAIARAIIRKPEVILFDEVTSALDFYSEKKIIDSINEWLNKTTFLFITHRIGTIKNFENIIVMNEGSVVAQGKHDYLIENIDIYKLIASNQKIK